MLRFLKLFGLGAALAILLLAAENSGQVGLAQSCTVTVNPGQSIQSALNSVGANAVICLAAGSWQENLSITTSNLTLQGQGPNQTFVTGSVFIQVSGPFTVANLTLQSSGTGPGPAGMVLIPAGSLQMGDSFNEGDSDERPVHTVTVSAFYMDVNDVTVGQWNAVATWASSHGYDLSSRSGSDNPGDQYPVVDVSWYEAVKWVNARSEKEGLTPCYYTDSSQSTVYRTGNVNVAIEGVKWSGCGYRLPTEAEWEKAARGGLSGQRYPWGNDIDCTKANYWPRPSSACVGHTTPVGSHPANGYGLYDMAGNIWQWVWDWYYSGYYSNSPGTDPRGSASGSSRVGRGGSWYCDAASCRVATRASLRPLPDPSPYFPLGFRLVRTAP